MINLAIFKKKGCFVIAFGARAPPRKREDFWQWMNAGDFGVMFGVYGGWPTGMWLDWGDFWGNGWRWNGFRWLEFNK